MTNLTEQEQEQLIAGYTKLALIGKAAEAIVAAAEANGVTIDEILPITIAYANRKASENKG